MAKHAKPTLGHTLSTTGTRAAATLAMASAGFLATTPAALADDGHGQGTDRHRDGGIGYRWSNDTIDTHKSQGVVNVADNTVAVPIQACHNSVPVNVAGVQVPIGDAAVTIAASSDGHGAATVSPDSCHQTTHEAG